MFRAFVFFLALFILIPSVVIFSQDEIVSEYDEADADSDLNESEEEDEPKAKRPREDIWFLFGGDTGIYSVNGFSFGGSFSFGYGTKSSVGLKISYFYNKDEISALEINFLLRFYFLRPSESKPLRTGYQGPFLQIMGGPVLFYEFGEFSIPSSSGMVSGGLCFGWRFVIGKRFVIEPSIRGGYPYLFGATVALGVRF